MADLKELGEYMISAIATAIRSHREDAAFRVSAWRAFEGKYPERKMLKNWRTKPQRDKDGKVVVCIVWDSNTIPPHRTWWAKNDEADIFEELSGDQASKRVDVGVYR